MLVIKNRKALKTEVIEGFNCFGHSFYRVLHKGRHLGCCFVLDLFVI